MLNSNSRYRFGSKFRAVREKKGLTLKQVAQSASVSESLISQIERNKVSPSVDTLLTLAKTLDLDLEYLFEDFRRQRKVTVIQKASRLKRELNGVVYEGLSSLDTTDDKHAIEAFVIKIGVGQEKGDLEYGHPGKEFGIILEGKGELIYGHERYSLSQGDSLTFSSNIPHRLRNTGDKVLQAIWAASPPRGLFLHT